MAHKPNALHGKWILIFLPPLISYHERIMQPTLCRALSLIAAACFALPGLAQSPAASTKPLGFEVVSIKRDKAAFGPASIQSPPGGDSIVLTDMSPRLLVGFAYDISTHNMVFGLPAWADSDTYDITAKVAEADLPAFHKLLPRQRNPMLRALLADRFHLQAHFESRSVPAYVLVIAKGGAKLTAAEDSKDPGGVRMGSGLILGTRAPIDPLLDALAAQLGRPVVDRTGLTGHYNYALRFAPVQASTDARPSQWPSIFTAIQDQLGLKLEPAKTPISVLVVNHIEKPSEN